MRKSRTDLILSVFDYVHSVINLVQVNIVPLMGSCSLFPLHFKVVAGISLLNDVFRPENNLIKCKLRNKEKIVSNKSVSWNIS